MDRTTRLLLSSSALMVLAGALSCTAPAPSTPALVPAAATAARATAPEAVAAPSDQAKIDAALHHYTELIMAMDHHGVAQLFAPDGEIVNPGAKNVRGREDIDHFLAGFADFHVLADELKVSSTEITGDHAVQVGTYQQKVRMPDSKVLEVGGRFRVEWVKVPSGEWLILRMGTGPLS